MPGRTPEEAVDAYLAAMRSTVACISAGFLRHTGCDPSRSHALTLIPDLCPLKAGTDLYISIGQQYRVICDDAPASGPWRVTTTWYRYTLHDEHSREILGYHWHPDGPSPVRYPHLSLGAGACIGRPELENTKAHLPTGRVALEEFVQLLIDVFGVHQKRNDASSLLRKNLEAFRKFARRFV